MKILGTARLGSNFNGSHQTRVLLIAKILLTQATLKYFWSSTRRNPIKMKRKQLNPLKSISSKILPIKYTITDHLSTMSYWFPRKDKQSYISVF